MKPDDLPLLAQGYRVSQALYAACSLRLPDLVHDGPRFAEELAVVVGADGDSLARLMRALAAEGFFVEDDQGAFGATAASDCLVGDSSDRLMVLGWRVLPPIYEAFGQLAEAVQSGSVAFKLATGEEFYQHLGSHPDVAQAYENAMESTGDAFAEMSSAYDFGQHHLVVDVGGGHGAFLACLMKQHRDLRGILFDTPSVVAGAATQLAAAGVAARVQVVGGDAFASVPPGADLYLTCTVLRCFDDAECLRLLQSIRAAMSPNARLLAFEQMIPEGPAQRPYAMMDLHTMVTYGGRDRTRAGYESLYARAGLRLVDAIPAGGPFAGFLGEPS